jgi:hypothetical protein
LNRNKVQTEQQLAAQVGALSKGLEHAIASKQFQTQKVLTDKLNLVTKSLQDVRRIKSLKNLPERELPRILAQLDWADMGEQESGAVASIVVSDYLLGGGRISGGAGNVNVVNAGDREEEGEALAGTSIPSASSAYTFEMGSEGLPFPGHQVESSFPRPREKDVNGNFIPKNTKAKRRPNAEEQQAINAIAAARRVL